MANEPIEERSDQELALWLLERMKDSAEFFATVRAARVKGRPDVLDESEHIERHAKRLRKLYQGDGDDTVEAPASLAGAIDEITARDVLSGREELIEKALQAYLDTHPKGAAGLPMEWQTTFDAARAEIEAKTSGTFEPEFVRNLAQAARQEIEQERLAEQARNAAAREHGA